MHIHREESLHQSNAKRSSTCHKPVADVTDPQLVQGYCLTEGQVAGSHQSQQYNKTRVIGYGVIIRCTYIYIIYHIVIVIIIIIILTFAFSCVSYPFRSNLRLPALPHPFFFITVAASTKSCSRKRWHQSVPVF